MAAGAAMTSSPGCTLAVNIALLVAMKLQNDMIGDSAGDGEHELLIPSTAAAAAAVVTAPRTSSTLALSIISSVGAT
jgi:hypothetical protein